MIFVAFATLLTIIYYFARYIYMCNFIYILMSDRIVLMFILQKVKVHKYYFSAKYITDLENLYPDKYHNTNLLLKRYNANNRIYASQPMYSRQRSNKK